MPVFIAVIVMFEIDDLILESLNDISIEICVFKFTKTSLKTPYKTSFRLLRLGE